MAKIHKLTIIFLSHFADRPKEIKITDYYVANWETLVFSWTKAINTIYRTNVSSWWKFGLVVTLIFPFCVTPEQALKQIEPSSFFHIVQLFVWFKKL